MRVYIRGGGVALKMISVIISSSRSHTLKELVHVYIIRHISGYYHCKFLGSSDVLVEFWIALRNCNFVSVWCWLA